jgi:methylaspartate mutase sigma subunit
MRIEQTVKLRSHPPFAAEGLDIVVSGTSSDSHTWNLIYLELLLREWGHRVFNIGACVPAPLLIEVCQIRRPDAIVLSSVNGHGINDGLDLIRRLRLVTQLAGTPVVIGGKLDTVGRGVQAGVRSLREAGFDAVFKGDASKLLLRGFLDTVAVRACR